MAKQSKFFRVAVEGDTVDGRTIERNWLTEMAASYNPATYAARVNMEHIRGITADKPFKAYGDVVALRADEVTVEIDGKPVKKMALFAQIDPTDDLVQINSDRQKLYTSIEVNPNFANTGKAYLMGLAVTDSPASLATEALQFVAHRKQSPTNHFSAAVETKIEFEEVEAPKDPASAGLFAAATKFFEQFTKPTEEPKQEPKQAPTGQEPANDNFDALRALIGEGFAKINAAVQAVSTETKAELGQLRTDHNALKASIENTDSNEHKRPPASGGAGNYVATDC
ncbi:MAG: GPO family capsid scaffolding protein [Bacillota bacterium]